ncbi:hypothetical protein ANCCAN_10285 [Ancylostoma caninum]|uniref:Uncharacterized protein n=1 Tax=Ancylostoma caninum TaxID=29170 RepID=A0A368GH63_ANCCA|nr:hypothetical protein ANCCAN_10285 [Ancylostoma caninum]
MFITPTESKAGIPGVVERLNSGIETYFEVHDGFNLDLIWWFSLVNGSTFPASYVKLVEVFEHKKIPGGAYKSNLRKQVRSNGSVRIGLSPSLTFDISCYFYSLNVTFVDSTYAFYSTDEKCYNRTDVTK